MRVVSLIASATEIVCALGKGALLVARSHECDHPADVVAGLPRITEPKFPTDGSSAAIDERIKEIVRSATSVYRVHPELLEAARPDLIVTQTQCEVCAVSERDVEEAVCQLVSTRPRILSLETNCLDDLFRDLQRVADALDDVEAGRALNERLRGRIAAIAAEVAVARTRPTVACIEWIDPLMAAGNWMPELVALAGGTNLFGEAGRHSPFMTWEALVAADPEVIVVTPCGFDIARTLEEVPLLQARPEWAGLRAVRAGQVFVADGNQYFNRPGPRLVESLEILAELVHPELRPRRYEGTGWVRVG
jgi:iron complex transport system substrate-binding protein